MESDARYRQFIEEINSIIIGFDYEGRTTFFNKFSEKLFGYDRDEVLGKEIFGKILPSKDSSGKANAPDYSQIVADPAQYYQNESEGVRRDGGRLRISWSAKAFRDKSGKITEILIDGNDITELFRERKVSAENAAILNALLESIPEGIMITDADHVVKRVSCSMGDLLGVSPERILNSDEPARLKMLDLYWPDGKKLENPGDLPLSMTAATGEPVIDQEVVLRCNGDLKTLSVSAAPIRNSQNAILGAVGIWHDITKRKRLTGYLEEERNFVNAVIQTSGALITVIDKDGRINRFNKACEELTGYTADEVKGRVLFKLFIPPEERDEVIGVASRLLSGEKKVDFENHWVTRSGEKRFIRWRNTILPGENGVPIYVVATGIDITDRRKAEEALWFERERSRVVIDNVNVGIILLDKDGTLLTFNKTALGWYGYRAESDMKVHSSDYRTDFELRDSEDALIPFESWPAPRAIKGEYVNNFEAKLVRKPTGDARWISFTTTPIHGSHGEVVRILMSMTDITERKTADLIIRNALEKAETGDRLLKALMDNVPEGITISDPKGTIHTISKHGQDLLGGIQTGMSIDHVVRSWSVFRPDGKTIMPIDELPLVRALKGETVRDAEILEVNSEGRRLSLLCNAAPIRDTTGNVVNGIIVWRDISSLKETQRALLESESRFRGIFHNAAVGILQVNETDHFIAVNPYVCSMLGYTEKELLTMNIHQLTAPEDRSISDEVSERIHTKGEKRISYEKRYLKADGSKLWVNVAISSLRDEEDRLTGSIAIIEDISERKSAEAALLESRERFRAAFRSIQDALIISDMETGRILEANEAWVSHWGYSLSETIGRRSTDLGFYTNIRDREQVLQIVRKEGRLADFEIILRTKTGELRNAVFFIEQLKLSNKSLILTIVHDITERKKAEDALRSSESTLSTIIDALPVGIITADEGGRLTRINPAATELWGIPPQTESWEQYENWIGWWPETGERIKAGDWALARALRNGEEIRNELVRNERFGTHEQRYYLANAVPLRDGDGRIIGGVVGMMDITERREAEEILQRRTAELEATINSIPDGYIIYDLNGNVMRMNTVAKEVLGFTEKEQKLRYDQRIDLLKIETPEGTPFPLDQIPSNRAMNGETVRDVVMKIRRHSRVYWLSVSAAPMFISDGRMLGVVMEFVNITSLKRAEGALRESEEKFRAVFEQAAIGIGRVSFHDARWIDVNDAFCCMLGYSAEEFRNTPWPQITHPDDIDLDLIPFQKMAAGKLDNYAVEKRFIHKKGHSVWVRLILSLVRDEQGQPDYEIAIIEDINERKKAEEALRESEARFRTMFQSHGAVMLLIEPDSGKIVDANTAAENFYGYSHDELRNMEILQINQEQTEQIASEIHKAVDKVRTVFEFNHRIASGQVRAVEVYSSPVHLGDKLLLFSIIHDITERRMLKKQLESERDFVNAVIQTSGALIVVFDRDGRITRFNQACQDLTGYTADEVRGRILFDLFILSEERENVIGIATRLLSGERKVENENHWVTRSGEKRYISWRNSILTNENGVPEYVIATGIDITDRNRAEKAMRESEVSLKHAQEIANLGSWELDLTANRLTWSDEIYRIFGLQPQEFGATYEAFLDRVHPDDRVAVDTAYSESIQKGVESYEIDHRVVRKDTGEIRYVHEKCQHVRDSQGTIVRSLGMVHDITERKFAEEQIRQKVELLENANRDLERFNRMAVGREMRMIELKREINSMCVRLGEPPRYSLQFTDEEKK